MRFGLLHPVTDSAFDSCPPRRLGRDGKVRALPGQTGADRAALDWAIAHGIPHVGWSPPA
jgi:hypothetical protein